MKKDIENGNDIKLLIDLFYEKVKQDSIIGFIFNDVAKVNWEHHLPRMYSFWESILFGTAEFTGNPMEVHIKLHHMFPLQHDHFMQWKKLFLENADALFKGTKTEELKSRAISIADLMEFKIKEITT